jgi:hypothetical protein
MKGGKIMKDRRFWFYAVVLLGGLFMVSSALAWTADPQCVGEAKNEFQFCVKACQEEFRNDKDACHDIDPNCGDKCRDDYALCLEPPLSELAGCKAACNADMESGKAWCRQNTAPGTRRRDRCIDWVQVAGFACRDQCRENVQPALAQCGKDFRTCLRACPPPPEEPK